MKDACQWIGGAIIETLMKIGESVLQVTDTVVVGMINGMLDFMGRGAKMFSVRSIELWGDLDQSAIRPALGVRSN